LRVREHEQYFDLIRSISTIIVVCFHYSCALQKYGIYAFNNYFHIFFNNGDWAFFSVTMFFMLSGAALFYNYSGSIDKQSFYFKRWQKLFPMFYLAWSVMFIIKAVTYKTAFWGGAPWKLVLTLFGLDGYFQYLGSNYYILGEWFLGPIVILYVLFPYLNILANTKTLLTTCLLVLCYLVVLNTDWFKISDFRNQILVY
jgi:surface polysaccharide O-acyltransferase-like enzyme